MQLARLLLPTVAELSDMETPPYIRTSHPNCAHSHKRARKMRWMGTSLVVSYFLETGFLQNAQVFPSLRLCPLIRCFSVVVDCGNKY